MKLDHVTPNVVVPVTGKLWVTEMVRALYGATSGAHDANDAVGDPITFAVPKYGRILSATCIDQADVASLLTLHVYNRRFTAAASDAAYTISADDAKYWVENIIFSVMNDEGSARVGSVVDIDREYYAPNGYLYAQFSTTGTPTFADNTMPMAQLFILPLDK